jgi:hypothetical protein
MKGGLWRLSIQMKTPPQKKPKKHRPGRGEHFKKRESWLAQGLKKSAKASYNHEPEDPVSSARAARL